MQRAAGGINNNASYSEAEKKKRIADYAPKCRKMVKDCLKTGEVVGPTSGIVFARGLERR